MCAWWGGEENLTIFDIIGGNVVKRKNSEFVIRETWVWNPPLPLISLYDFGQLTTSLKMVSLSVKMEVVFVELLCDLEMMSDTS